MTDYLKKDAPNPFAPNKPRDQTRVVVAMSGGVDSSVVAALMVEQGYDVVGMTMQLYDHGEAVAKSKSCCAGQDINDARKIANQLGIPHYVLDYESRFREAVMEDFADSYIAGFTPIPCVRCNQTVKFHDMLETARDLEADALVTGHYVRRIIGEHGPELHRGLDHNKDQSYFLFATTAKQLDFVHFPLGDQTKDQTRAHAVRLGLSVADKPDSQDICFVPDGNYAKVVERLRPGALDKGDIIHLDGRNLGQHDGIINFTIGQRRGLDIGGGEILYVIKLDPTSNQVIVGPKEALGHSEFRISELNWLAQNSPSTEGYPASIKIRSNGEPIAATIYASENGLSIIKLASPERAISPGQACVIYDHERVLGGGWITNDHQ